MATVFKLTLDKNSNAGLLSIVGEIRRNSHLKQAAEKESANGYIMSDSAPCGGSLRFDITTIIGDIENASNALFDFVKATVDKPERYAYTQGQLKDYFADADFSVQRIEQLMGKFNASFGVTGSKGFTVYTCANIQQVVFSILHFLILNGYKFANCRHCGRLYATQTLKNIYCSRTSPYPGYERYYGKDAVKRINDALEKRRDTVYKRLRVRAQEYGYSSKHGTILRNFQDKCYEYKMKIRESASIENLSSYAIYLQSGEGLPKRYERVKWRDGGSDNGQH